MDVNHLRLLADCMQNLPENMKPCSSPLIKIIIISLSAYMAISLTTSLKSIKWNSIKLITYCLILRVLRCLSLVQSVPSRRIRVEIICLRVDLLALGSCMRMRWLTSTKTPVLSRLFLCWRSHVTDNHCESKTNENIITQPQSNKKSVNRNQLMHAWSFHGKCTIHV